MLPRNIRVPHAIQIRRTGGLEVLNWTPIEVGEPGPGQVCLHQVAAGLNYIDVYHRTRREALEASANELFEVVASGKVRINVNQRSHHPDHLIQYPQEFAMSKTAITSPELAPPVGPFSQAIEVGGFLYFSGQVGQDPATGKVVEGGIVAETERVFRNLEAVLKAAGKSFDHVARAAVYLTNMGDFGAMNRIYARHFNQPFPARTTIAVAALALGACVEIDLVVEA
jgi:2-iminobutanoate/2-iminopropanoate deaminase